MVQKSVVCSANVKSESLRSTIPIEISRQFKLAPGDVLDWAIEENKNKKFIIVRKLE